VDSADWLKAMAIVATTIGHFGYYFVEHDVWMEVAGRFAAPTFFFFIGFARTRTIPLHWAALCLLLTGLESWNDNWHWAVPNIFLNFILIRLALPYVEGCARRYPAATGAILSIAFFVALPIVAEWVDYGAEGWAWALFGLYQRLYVESRSASEGKPATDPGPMRWLTCAAAAAMFVREEQLEYVFSLLPLVLFAAGIGLLSLRLLLFRRGPSPVQPPERLAGTLRYVRAPHAGALRRPDGPASN
jgi:hypothetical protein